jgi:hypothetical protein
VNVQASLWRSIAVFRVASLVYAAVLIVVDRADYERLGWAWAVLAGMAAWTAFTSAAYAVPARRTRRLLAADLLVTAAALASTALLQYPGSVAKAAMPVTATWVAGPVLAWAVAGGIRAGVAAALVLGLCDLTLRHQSLAGVYRSPALNGTVLLLLAGVAVGYVSTLADRAERAVQRATEIEAASRERDRLARGIHDSVLQVLALVQRRGGRDRAAGRRAGGRAARADRGRRRGPRAGIRGSGLEGPAHPGSARLGVGGHARRAGAAARAPGAGDGGRRPRGARQRAPPLRRGGARLGAGGRPGGSGHGHHPGRRARDTARPAGAGRSRRQAGGQPGDLRPDARPGRVGAGNVRARHGYGSQAAPAALAIGPLRCACGRASGAGNGRR